MAQSHSAAVFRVPAPWTILAHGWRLILLRGLLTLFFGIAVAAWPHLAVSTLVMVFGVFALIDGAASVLTALFGEGVAERWWLAAWGLISALAGAAALITPEPVGHSFLTVVGAWAFVRGFTEALGALTTRIVVRSQGALFFGGLVSMLFGIAVAVTPLASAIGLTWLVSAWAITAAAFAIGWAFRLQSFLM